MCRKSCEITVVHPLWFHFILMMSIVQTGGLIYLMWILHAEKLWQKPSVENSFFESVSIDFFLNCRSLLCTSQKRLASAFWRPEVKWWLWINWLYVPPPAPTLCCSKAKEQPGRLTVTSELLESLVPMSSLWCDQRAGNSNVPVADVLLVDTRNRIPSHMFCPKILDNNNRYKMLRFQINFVCRFIFNPGFGVWIAPHARVCCRLDLPESIQRNSVVKDCCTNPTKTKGCLRSRDLRSTWYRTKST